MAPVGLARAVLVAALYFLTARLSLALVEPSVGIAAVWPPSGLMLAVLILRPRREWPTLIAAVFMAISLANLSAGFSLPVSLGFGVANCAESALAAAALTRGGRGPFALTSLREVSELMLVAVVGTNAVTALLGAAVAAIGLGAPFWEAWRVWWLTDGLGMLLVGSSILTWAASNPDDHEPMTAARWAELGLVITMLALVVVLTFRALPTALIGPSPYLTFSLLLWVAVRFGPRAAAPSALLLAIIAVWYTAQGRGPFAAATASLSVRVLEVQAFLLVEGLSTLALAALSSERHRARLALVRANDVLESRVTERTAALLAANERLQREIAERAQAEAALRESQERLRQALHLARSYSFEVDVPSGAVIRSPDCGDILGLEGEAAIYDHAQSYLARVHPDDQPTLADTAYGLRPDRSSYRICYRLIRSDGEILTLEETAQAAFDHDGRLVRIFGIVHDVTERQRAAERAVRLQQVTAALLAASTPDQVASVVVEQGVPALGASLGSVVVPAPDRGSLVLIASTGLAPEAWERWARFPLDGRVPLAEAVRTLKPVWIESRAELLARFSDLQTVQTENNAFASLPLVANGHLVGALGVSFRQARTFSAEERGYISTLADLCAQALDRARLYDAEQALRASAEAAVRLRDQFLSIASHELKTPLTVLLGNVQLILRRAAREGTMNERDRRSLASVAEQAQRLDRLIAMLLDISRIDAGQLILSLGSVDLVALLRRIADEIQPTLPHHQIVLEIVDEPLTITADELRLEQLLQNLIYNGVKYSPGGGEIVVTAEGREEGVQVQVIDNGIGIPADDLPQLFERFFRASNTDRLHISGMGIGLYVARAITERHGGTIEASSAEGEGTTFTIRLPWAGQGDKTSLPPATAS